jgi:hypothetical protein
MDRTEILERMVNTQAPKPPICSSARMAEAERIRLEVEAHIANGGNYQVLESTESRSMTAKEQMNANYNKSVEDGKVMDPPINPKK